jgi:hypothetical protein
MSTRPATGFTKKKSGAGCLPIAVGLFALACVVAGAIALVLFLKERRAAPIDDAPGVATRIAPSTVTRPTTTPPSAPSGPASARRPVPLSPKRN